MRVFKCLGNQIAFVISPLEHLICILGQGLFIRWLRNFSRFFRLSDNSRDSARMQLVWQRQCICQWKGYCSCLMNNCPPPWVYGCRSLQAGLGHIPRNGKLAECSRACRRVGRRSAGHLYDLYCTTPPVVALAFPDADKPRIWYMQPPLRWTCWAKCHNRRANLSCT